MIKAEELRIGNYVEFTNDATVVTVTEITQASVVVKNNDKQIRIELDQISGIQLTPEILENAGFTRTVNNQMLYELSEYVFFSFGYFPGLTMQCKGAEKSCTIDNIIYLHQLQNFFSIITGAELKFKELPVKIKLM